MSERACPECGTTFTPRTNQRYCQKTCQERVASRRYRDLRAEKVAAYQAEYRQRPEARERARVRLLQPDVQDQRRAYRRLPHVRARLTKARRLWAYDLTSDEFDALYAQQAGRCALCDVPGPAWGKEGLYIDHDHATGKARGLLCRDCNQGLAALERHGPSWALKALTYLGDPPVAVMRRKAS